MCAQGFNSQLVIMGSDNVLAPNWRRNIIWTCDGLARYVLWNFPQMNVAGPTEWYANIG